MQAMSTLFFSHKMLEFVNAAKEACTIPPKDVHVVLLFGSGVGVEPLVVGRFLGIFAFIVRLLRASCCASWCLTDI